MDCQWMKLIHQPTSTRQVSKKWPQNRRTCYDEDDCFCPEQKCQDCLYYQQLHKKEKREND